MTTHRLYITGLDCPNCAAGLVQSLKLMPQVRTAELDFSTAVLRVAGDLDDAMLTSKIRELGYDVREDTQPQAKTGFWRFAWQRRDSRLAIIGGMMIVLALMMRVLNLPSMMTKPILLGAMLVALLPIARSGLRDLWTQRNMTINLLMTIAAIGAVAIGDWLEAATVIVLFALGETLEGYTSDRARNSVRQLLDVAPNTALVVRGDQRMTLPASEIKIDDIMLVPAGERIALDGVVVAGTSSVNQAPITGESVPVSKTVGDQVWAGSVVGEQALQIRVTAISSDSVISRIVRLVEDVQQQKANSQRMVDRFARWYTPLVVVLAALIAVVPPLLGGDFNDWLYRALTLLVIACPCALVISAPVTVISGITAAARQGVLIKGGLHLEALGAIKAIAFDKTGTLTKGEPTVTQSRSFACNSDESCEACNRVLTLAASVEQASNHPIARAITKAAQQRELAYMPADSVVALAGRGIAGQLGDQRITVGSHALFEAEHPHDATVCAIIQEQEAQGQTAMLVCDGDGVRGVISVADALRPETAQVVHDLHAANVATIMLTGDNATVAQAIASQVKIDTVKANLMPEAKLNAIRELQAQYGAVAMVGDGINDTPALAAADVGIAMGGAGSAQAMETADVVLMADNLKRLPFALKVARFTRRLIWQNVTISFATKAIVMAFAVTGFASLWLAIAADVGVSLLVTLNGMRPLRLKAEG